MAKNRTSVFGATEGLNFNTTPTPVPEKEQTEEVKPTETKTVSNRPYGTTQGKKGQKAKRINMAFSDENHEYILRESRRQGYSATAFVNKILDEYRQGKP